VTADDRRARPADGALERAIAVQVRRHRRGRGLTVGELALRAGISKAMLSKIENSLTSSSLTTLARLAAALDVPVTALFYGADGEREAGFGPTGRPTAPSRRLFSGPWSGMLRIVTGTPDDQAYAAVLRQAAHDAVRAVLAAPPDSVTASMALRGVTAWLVRTYGAGAAQDLAEELAVDLAEAFDALAAVEARHPLSLLDAWFHDQPEPAGVPDVPRSRPAVDDLPGAPVREEDRPLAP
jgi:DNA-binding XRE family transcriptional regulator